MSMSTYVVGFKPVDAKLLKMKAVWDAREAAKVEIPEEVEDFFGSERPDASGVKLEESDLANDKGSAVSEYNAEGENGYEVDLTKLPKDVKIIRFVNSY